MHIALIGIAGQAAGWMAAVLRRAGHRVSVHADDPWWPGDYPSSLGLVLLGVAPDLRAFDTLKRARGVSEVPIVLCGTGRSDHRLVRALHLGADDWVTLPCPEGLFLAIAAARMRRPLLRRHADAFCLGALCLDPARGVVLRAGKRQAVTATELRILAALARGNGEVVEREVLLRCDEPDADAPDSRALDVHVCNLRRRLDLGHRIETLRGRGYRLHIGALRLPAFERGAAPEPDRAAGSASGPVRSRRCPCHGEAAATCPRRVSVGGECLARSNRGGELATRPR